MAYISVYGKQSWKLNESPIVARTWTTYNSENHQTTAYYLIIQQTSRTTRTRHSLPTTKLYKLLKTFTTKCAIWSQNATSTLYRRQWWNHLPLTQKAAQSQMFVVEHVSFGGTKQTDGIGALILTLDSIPFFAQFSCPILKSEYIIKKDKMVVIVTCFCIYLE